MKRRELVIGLIQALFWPLAVRAQQTKSPVIGFLGAASASEWVHLLAAFDRGLSETGYKVGQNIRVEYRWAEGDFDRLPSLAADLVAQGVSVILAAGGSVTPRQAKAATSTIPIVFVTGGDPIASELVPQLNRPGGNVTGFTSLSTELSAKRVEVLRELLPRLTIVGELANHSNPFSATQTQMVKEAVERGGQKVVTVNASSRDEIETAYSALVMQQVDGLVINTDPLFVANRTLLTSLSARHRVPTIYSQRDYVLAGGLISYGSNFLDAYRQAGNYVGRILKGEKPGDLPVMQPTTFQLVVNLKTANALGIAVPPTLLARADEVIE